MSQTELRVLQIVKGIDIGGHSGGSEHFGLRLARQLRNMGLDVTLCAYYRFDTPVEAEWLRLLEKEGIHCFFATASHHLNLWAAIRAIAHIVRERNITLIHSHFQVGTLAGIGVKFLSANTRLLRTAHFPYEFGLTFAGWISRSVIVQLVYPFLVDIEAGVSAFLVQMLDNRPLAKLFGKKSHCIYNAISESPLQVYEVPLVEPFIRRTAGAAWVITSIGVLEPRKCFETLIKAMPSILKRIPQVHCAVVGSGVEEARLRSLADQLGVADHVWFLGQRTDVPAILKHTDVFVLSSRAEALSTVILEAIQSGTPVIASNIPGNTELIEHEVSGILFPVGDVEALTERVYQAYLFPGRIAGYARKAAGQLSQFSLQEAASRYIRLYQTLTAKMRH